MKSTTSRRSFLKRAVLAGGAASAAHLFPCPNILGAARSRDKPASGDKLNCVVIGCGGRGQSHLSAVAGENLVAVVDPDEKRRAAAQGGRKGGANAQGFADYRQMFDKMAKQIDAVFVATPNHQHAPPSLIAMQLGKGIYCEKPLCHEIAEARKLAEMAAESKVATQMGNQGHCEEGYRRLCEYVAAGIVGPITETHSWTDRANGGTGPRPPAQAAPAGMNWDAWIGPAPFREFHKDLHPHEWHGWYDFGNGSLGNMSCHTMDGVYWALKLEHPLSVEAVEVFGGSDERCPVGTTIRWDFPARGDMPAVKAFWYDGRRDKGGRNFPPLLEKLQKQYPGEKFGDGTLYVGEKGILHTGTYGGSPYIVGKGKKDSDLAAVPKTLPRPKGSFADFLRACREHKNDTASAFAYSARLTEFILLGNLAQHAGRGKKVEWDGPNMKVTNLPDLNQFVSRPYRKGWTI
jgi:predicted dehydrogenase